MTLMRWQFEGWADFGRFLLSLCRLLLRTGVALVFIVAGLSKIGDPGRFLEQILYFGFVPYPLAFATAMFLPWLEIIAGTMLLSFRFTCAASVLLIFLTAAFISFLSAAHAAGITSDCGCFGNWFRPGSYWLHLALNIGILSVLVFHLDRSWKLLALFEKE